MKIALLNDSQQERDSRGRFVKGHKFLTGSEAYWIKKGQRLSVGTEFKKKTGKWVDKKGYIVIYSPKHPYKNSADGVLEHRLVVEKYLGRYLKSDEFVHHINGDKKDNRIENLEVMDSSSHQKLHWRLRKETHENLFA